MAEITPRELYQRLIDSNIIDSTGEITMTLNGTSVTVKSTDTIGNNIQEWLAEWLRVNNIYFATPDNTQNFPDFYLSSSTRERNLMEVKSYFSPRKPAFDVANFDSYINSVSEHPYRLDADYLIFAYDLDDGELKIKKLFLKKVWQITGKSKDYDLTCQRKNGQVYNIRPNSFQSERTNLPVFESKEEFIAALYKEYKNKTNQVTVARLWLQTVIDGYREFSGEDISARVNSLIR